MNQILSTKIIKNRKFKQFNVIFFISIFAILIFLIINIYFFIKLKNEENYSNQIAKNYEVYKLYANSNKTIEFQHDYDILGNIIIPKIDINYPIFSGISDELLKISPCRFSGQMPPINSNLCIAGHNYNDLRFFSKLNDLNNNDLIIIEDINNKYNYYVYDKYEVNDTNFSPVLNYYSDFKELTLVTCNNYNNKRIIVKAKTESL